ncbi:MAG: hypothetical protein AAB316_00670 [Bacteroidota bacterium]
MTTQPNYDPMMVDPPKSNRSQYAIAGVIGAVLLIIVGVLAYSNMKKTDQLETVTTEKTESTNLQTELDNQYQSAIAELESLKSDNDELNKLIEAQKDDLQKQKTRITALIKEGKQLDQVRREIASMKTQGEQYVAEIEKLKAENTQLSEAKVKLTSERDTLSTHIERRTKEIETLTAEKTTLTAETEELSKSVKIGSVVQVRDVRVEGLKVRNNGKTDDKKRAKKVDMLKVCFTTIGNDVVAPGVEQFHVRILNPAGETLSIESLGSGKIVNEKTGEETPFTQFAETEYANDEQNLCLLWNPDISFSSGKYIVEVYNKGFLAGKGDFELK